MPLSIQALDILDRIATLNRPARLSLGFRPARRAVCAPSVPPHMVARLLQSFGLVDGEGRRIVVHGFRSTFRVWAGEQAKANFSACEAALAHIQTDQTVVAYDRSDYFEERRELMQKWADYVLPRRPA